MSRCAGEKKIQLDTLLKLCAEINKSCELEPKVKKLAKLLAESPWEWEKRFAFKQAKTVGEAVTSAAEKRVQKLTWEIGSMSTSHLQKFRSHESEMRKLKELVAFLERKVDDVEYERNGAIACELRMQSAQQKLQSAVSCTQKEISAISSVLENDCEYVSGSGNGSWHVRIYLWMAASRRLPNVDGWLHVPPLRQLNLAKTNVRRAILLGNVPKASYN